MVKVVGIVVMATSTGVSRPPLSPLLLPNLTLVVPMREIIPVFVPPAVGVKLTSMDADPLGGSITGRAGPIKAKPVPEIAARVMVKFPSLGLVTVTE
jgi:hypothetical protein